MSLTHWSSVKSIYASPMGRAQTTATKMSIALRAFTQYKCLHTGSLCFPHSLPGEIAICLVLSGYLILFQLYSTS
ncbi:hypothetical protein L208DRAFT_276001 [Tricholoma matsutake]|nr:hypothetical protein L208DRAFT_276001 [Tricholoma matsutake 945]